MPFARRRCARPGRLISRAIAIRSPARPGVQSTSWRASRHAARVVGVVEGAGEGERLLRQRAGPRPLGGHRVVQLAREARGEVGLQRGAGCPYSAAERGLQLVDDGVAGHREPGAESLDTERDPGRAAPASPRRTARSRASSSNARAAAPDRRCGRGRRPPRRAGRPARAPRAGAPVSSTARRALARWAAASREGQSRAVRRWPPRGPSGPRGRCPRAATAAAVWRARSAATTGAPRAWRCSSASAMRWCSSSRRVTASPAATVSRKRSWASRVRVRPPSRRRGPAPPPARRPRRAALTVAGSCPAHLGQHVGHQLVCPPPRPPRPARGTPRTAARTRRPPASRAAAGTAAGVPGSDR